MRQGRVLCLTPYPPASPPRIRRFYGSHGAASPVYSTPWRVSSARSKGQLARTRIGYFTPYLPVEILWACGFSPVRLRPGRGHAAADGHLPRNFSVEARCLLAAALEGRLDAGAVVFLDEDDTSRRACDVWRAFAGIPVIGPVSVPRLAGPASAERYAGALAGLAGELAALSGQPLAGEGLRQAIDLYNRQRALWLALRRLWLEGGLATGEWQVLRWLALTDEVESANEALAARLGAGPDPPAGAPAGLRLLLLGAMEVPRPFLALLEEGGARSWPRILKRTSGR